MKSAHGFSSVLIIIIGAIVLGIAALNYASNNLRGTNIRIGDQSADTTKSTKEQSSGQTNSDAKFDIKITDNYFPVEGTTVLDLQNFMLNKGPGLETGHKGVANCRMGYEWIPHVSSSKNLSQCRIDKLELLGKIECTYPKWDPPAGATQETKNKWDDFMKKVRMHEQGHIDIDKKQLNNMFEELKKITPKSTCEQLSDEVKKTGENIISRDNQENQAYDLETQHGEKQGAYLIPPN